MLAMMMTLQNSAANLVGAAALGAPAKGCVNFKMKSKDAPALALVGSDRYAC